MHAWWKINDSYHDHDSKVIRNVAGEVPNENLLLCFTVIASYSEY